MTPIPKNVAGPFQAGSHSLFREGSKPLSCSNWQAGFKTGVSQVTEARLSSMGEKLLVSGTATALVSRNKQNNFSDTFPIIWRT